MSPEMTQEDSDALDLCPACGYALSKDGCEICGPLDALLSFDPPEKRFPQRTKETPGGIGVAMVPGTNIALKAVAEKEHELSGKLPKFSR